ncbi:short chain alcohol dehydrogenase, putative [Ricinus communis]|uniref:Short chain alcohol dehydrogenase, putative n=1 Tax=Ricinus communis TaxID=3988 RepID=B9SW01_RICCO|nr:short chain alcohol dehydrogenase, putative [Ricinus communis]|eukprot:XP_002530170.1 secoisolariciresinol dehydrogenase [Ricinus communis]
MSTSSTSISTTKRLEGKVAIITGGASGIGESSARLFVKHGAKVIIADIQDELGHSLCKVLGSDQEIISYIHCDVTSDSDMQKAVDFAVSKYGKLDIMFSNAGTSCPSPSILATDNQDFKRVFDVNVFGAFLAAKHAARVMIPAKRGCIIFTASNLSVTCFQSMHPYIASKHAVVGLAKNLCVELGQYGIRVNCVSPFAVVTPLLKKHMGLMEMEKEKIRELISKSANLKGAVLEPEDVAEAAVYLGSDESKYVSGLNLLVDGGYVVTNPSFEIAMKT